MKNTTFAALLICLLAITLSSTARSERPVSGALAQKLWDAAPGDLAAFLIPWLNKPVFDVRNDAPELLWTPKGYPQFAKPTWKDHVSWVVDENGFRTILELEELPDEEKLWARGDPYHGFVFRASGFGKEWWRELSCYKQKGDTNYDERRIFRVYRSPPESTLWFAARLHVFDLHPGRTVGELLEHLRTRYGTFDALCSRIAVHLASPKKSD